MEGPSPIGPTAELPPTSTRVGEKSSSSLDWEFGNTYGSAYFGEDIAALSSGTRTFDSSNSNSAYKRRRLDVEAPSTPCHFYTTTETTYEAPLFPFFPTTQDNHGSQMMPSAAPCDGSLQLPPEPDTSMQWNGLCRDSCVPFCPSWPFLYTPLSQYVESGDKFEAYQDDVPPPGAYISQQYISPGLLEAPEPRYALERADTLLLQSQSLSPAQGCPAPSMSIREEAPLITYEAEASRIQLPLTYSTGHRASANSYPVCTYLPSAVFYGTQAVEQCASTASANGPSGARTTNLPIGSPSPQAEAVIIHAEHFPGGQLTTTKRPGTKRGPFRDPRLRAQTAERRKDGACIECARQRIRCIPNHDDPPGPCLNCTRMQACKLPRIPCLRYRIMNIRLNKPGQVPGFEWTQRGAHKDIKHWASDEVKTVYLSEGLSNTYMKLVVREFVPQKGDKLERSWVYDGNRRSAPIPPYALLRREDAKQAYKKHMVATESGALDQITGLASSLLRKTYRFAVQLRQDPSLSIDAKNLLDITFQLWMVVRFSTRSTWIVGKETLGMPRDILDESPNPGKIPLPPVLGAQLDSVLIHDIQENIRRQLLKALDKAFRRYQHPNWLVTYLVSFILLHNAALITSHDAKYAQKHGMECRFAREESVAEYHMGATVILAHFHNCTRNHPFSDSCNEADLKTLSAMTEDQIDFIRETRVDIKTNEGDWARIRKDGLYEDDFYFVSQLYQEPWTPEAFSVQ